jgi:hypothetical protein
MAELSRSAMALSALVFLLAATWAQAADEGAERAVKIDDHTFKCITQMTPVRHFYVDNLSGNLQGTVAVAEKGRGDYPEGGRSAAARSTSLGIPLCAQSGSSNRFAAAS